MFPETIRRIAVAIVAAATVIPAVTYSQHRAAYIQSAHVVRPMGGPADVHPRLPNRRDNDAATRRPLYREASDGQRCTHSSGGTLLGAIAGGLLGNAAVGHRGNNSAGIWAGEGGRAPVSEDGDRDC
ncbi:hypothetical protein [Sphingomonas sp.]|uniref:hypothetical protein n=1 Tax=Sphingomonas sp. TaxID=28214 RepID=UPI003B3ACC47